MLTSSLGHVSVTEVDGTAFTGLYAADGSLNVYDATSDTVPNGLYHPCGAMNITITDGTTLTGRYANNGSLYVVIDSTQYGVYHSCGAMNITGIVVSNAVSFLAEYGPYGMVMDFTDASIAIDDVTDVLNYNSIGQVSSGALIGPGAKLTYSAPSVKLTEQADGNLAFQAHNLLQYSEAHGTSPWLTSSGGVASTPTRTNDYAPGPIGTMQATRLQFNLNGGTASTDISAVAQSVALMAGATYARDVWIKSTDGSSSYVLQIQKPDGTADNVTVTGSWQKFTVAAVAGGAVQLAIRLRGANGNSNTADVLVSGDHLRRTPSASDYIKTTTAAAYDLPYVYSSGVRTGIMDEPAATNVTFPSMPSAADAAAAYSGSTIFGVSTYPTIAAGSLAAPISGAPTIRLTWNGVTARYGTPTSATAKHIADSGAQSVVTSVYARAVSGTVSNVSLVQRQTTGGPIGSVTPTLTEAWQRVAKISTTVGGNGGCGWYLESSGTGVIEIVQYDHCVGTVATSPIITYGSTVLRAVDNIYTPTTNFPYSTSELFLYGEIIWPSTAVSSATIASLNFNGVAATNFPAYIQVSATNSVAAYFSNSASKSFASTPTAGSTQKIAGTFNTVGTLAAATNQGQAVAVNSASIWNGLTNRLQIGTIVPGTQPATNVIIKKIMVLPVYDTAKAATVTA